jgi:Putative viral replication protein
MKTSTMEENRWGKSWAFTLNNWNWAEYHHLTHLVKRKDECVYIVFGKEVGKSGTPHLQGFIDFSDSMLLEEVKAIVSQRAHFEVARMQLKAIEYCKKDGDVYEEGIKPLAEFNRFVSPPMQEYKCNGQSAMYIRGSAIPSGCAVHGLQGCPIRQMEDAMVNAAGRIAAKSRKIKMIKKTKTERINTNNSNNNNIDTTTTTTTNTTRNGSSTTITITTVTIIKAIPIEENEI